MNSFVNTFTSNNATDAGGAIYGDMIFIKSTDDNSVSNLFQSIFLVVEVQESISGKFLDESLTFASYI